MFRLYKIAFLPMAASIICLYSMASAADVVTCPQAEDVRNKTISQEFDWTTSEDVSLHSILNVHQLHSVSIENYGEFLACSYDSETIQLRLDGKPIKVGCTLKPQSEPWSNSEPGQYVCLEKNKAACLVLLDC